MNVPESSVKILNAIATVEFAVDSGVFLKKDMGDILLPLINFTYYQ